VIRRLTFVNAGEIERETIYIGFCRVALHTPIDVKTGTQLPH
jgi:hypothetical protein